MRIAPTISCCFALAAALAAQERKLDPEDLVLRVDPPKLEMDVGETATIKAQVVDVGGRPVKAQVFFFSRARRSLAVEQDGKVLARRPGEYEIIARSVLGDDRGPSVSIPVTVVQPEPVGIKFSDGSMRVHEGTSVAIAASVVDKRGEAREDLRVELESTVPAVLELDGFGSAIGRGQGAAVVVATAKVPGGEEFREALEVEVVANPVASIELSTEITTVRTGDVVHFGVETRNESGQVVRGVPVELSFFATPDDNLGNGATGQIEPDGRFVAETPGLYTILATCGGAMDRMTIRATERFVDKRKLEFVGHGPVLDVHTSDLWVWEGVDGRDYAVTGTWGANGEAHFWDVTDPAKIRRISTFTVDARTVNDVKVSEDGRICVLSREGASNRKNGIVVLDVSNPSEPKQLSGFDDELTGGVHNVFISKNHVYALSAGRRYDIINIDDPESPMRVGSFQLFQPGASIHDVWVVDGIAYSSNWRYGLQLVDVGNGKAGGSPSNPVHIGSYAYPNGWNHAAFPYWSKSSGKFYVIGGDEAFPYGLHVTGKPTYPRGWLHFVDFSDMESPREVARYEVPEAGTHNLWVDGDTLYVAYYNGGVRVVDISGELMGDLYRQGREIAWYLPTDENGVVPNAPMVWGPQPHKGTLFFSDWNSGLWAVQVGPGHARGAEGECCAVDSRRR